MPPKIDDKAMMQTRVDSKTSKAVALLRRSGTDSMASLVKVGAKYEIASAMSRMILKNVHLSLLSRREEIFEHNATENGYAHEQRDGEAPALKWVRIAAKPDPRPLANNHWSESSGNNPEKSSAKWQGGINGQTQRSKNAKKPAFILKDVKYDDDQSGWRKHYAKDKFGKYRGLEQPAEDCILIPEDEIKWRSQKPHLQTEAPPPDEEESSLPVQELKRSASFPESGGIDPSVESTDLEQALFVAEDGHTASRIVDEPHIKLGPSPDSATLPSQIFLSPPTSPRPMERRTMD